MIDSPSGQDEWISDFCESLGWGGITLLYKHVQVGLGLELNFSIHSLSNCDDLAPVEWFCKLRCVIKCHLEVKPAH